MILLSETVSVIMPKFPVDRLLKLQRFGNSNCNLITLAALGGDAEISLQTFGGLTLLV